MPRPIYRSKSFGTMEKFSWLKWEQDNHEYLGVLLGKSSNSYFNLLALYQDNIPFAYPREFFYYDHEFPKVKMQLHFHPACVEYIGKKEQS